MLLFIQSIQNESDRNFVEQLYNEYHCTMLYIAQGILKDRYRAEDAVTQTFIKIIDKLQNFSFTDCKKTRGLIGILVRDVCYDMLKYEKYRKVIPIEIFENMPDSEEDAPLEQVISEESYAAVLACLSKLNDTYRDTLALKYVYEYTNEEISEILDITPGNVYIRLHRAKKALAQELKKRGISSEHNGTSGKIV